MKLTTTQRRALQIFRDHGPLMPKEFAKFMWPDSPAWQRSIKCGHGAHPGGGMYLAAGGYIGKLVRRGWLRPIRWTGEFSVNDYGITPTGREALSSKLPA